MREMMPGRPPADRDQYDPDEAAPQAEFDRMQEMAAQYRQHMIDNPPAAPDEFAIAAAKVVDKQERHRGPEWHRARMALGG